MAYLGFGSDKIGAEVLQTMQAKMQVKIQEGCQPQRGDHVLMGACSMFLYAEFVLSACLRLNYQTSARMVLTPLTSKNTRKGETHIKRSTDTCSEFVVPNVWCLDFFALNKFGQS